MIIRQGLAAYIGKVTLIELNFSTDHQAVLVLEIRRLYCISILDLNTGSTTDDQKL